MIKTIKDSLALAGIMELDKMVSHKQQIFLCCCVSKRHNVQLNKIYRIKKHFICMQCKRYFQRCIASALPIILMVNKDALKFL